MLLFWDKGFHATSLKDLEVALCMKPGSIYAAFDSKENLYLLALERYLNTSRTTFRAMMAAAVSPLQGLADHFRMLARLAQNDKARQACMLTKTLLDTRTTDPAIVEKSQEYMDAMLDEFSAGFSDAMTRGELRPSANPNRLARRYQANIAALRFELARGADVDDTLNLAEDMAQEIEQLRDGGGSFATH